MKTKITALLLFVSVVFSACVSTFDQFTFDETKATKVQMESLMNKATTPYSDNLSDINALKTQMQNMLTYERNKQNNTINRKMWELITREGSTINDFFKTWESQGTMSQPFIDEFKPQINEIFDLMIDYESKKDKQAENALRQILSAATN